MPHDKNGHLIEKGDEVLIRATVREVWPGADTCQLSVITTEKMLPEHAEGTHVTLNACQVEKVMPMVANRAEA